MSVIYISTTRVASFLTLLWLLSFLVTSANAHDAFSGKVDAEIDTSGNLLLVVNLASVTVEGFVDGISDRDNQISEANIDNIGEYLANQANNFYVVTLDGRVLSPENSEVEIRNREEAVIFRIHYPGPIIGMLGLDNAFIAKTNPEFKATLKVLDANQVQLGLFVNAVDDTYVEVAVAPVTANAQPNNVGVFSRFLQLGIQHIVLGYDHLLFLLGLLVVCIHLRETVGIITCFTLAHSLTLALAVLNIVTLPSVWVELVIAASIAYVGVENLYTKHRPKHRWILTFAFGLVHGLGFASVLRDIGLGTDGAPIAIPLVSFNLGVEIGQLILASIFLVIFWRLRKIEGFVKKGLPAISLVVVLFGLYWMGTRSYQLLG